jgi:hypothetical protein
MIEQVMNSTQSDGRLEKNSASILLFSASTVCIGASPDESSASFFRQLTPHSEMPQFVLDDALSSSEV